MVNQSQGTLQSSDTVFHTRVLEPKSGSQPSDKLTGSGIRKTCVRLSTSSRNAQFPRLSVRAFRKRMKTNHPCRILKLCSDKHATTTQVSMKIQSLLKSQKSHVSDMFKLNKTQNSSASSFKLLRVCCSQLTNKTKPKAYWHVGGDFHTTIGDEFLYPLMEVRRRPWAVRVEVTVVLGRFFTFFRQSMQSKQIPNSLQRP